MDSAAGAAPAPLALSTSLTAPIPSATPIPPAARTEPAAPTEAQADSAGTEIGDVIHAEHRRILRLFGALDDVARRGDAGLSRPALRQLWVRIADLLEHHIDAEEQICFPALFGGGEQVMALTAAAVTDHNDIREAVAQARLLEPGSARWWRAVATAHSECSEHFRREELELVAALGGVLSDEESRRAVRRWETFPMERAQRGRSAAIFAPVRG